MRDSGTPRWRTIRLALCALAALLAACSSSADVGGTWQGVAPARGTGNDLIFGANDQQVGVRLVIGEYGPDLAGVLHFYTSSAFDRARSADSPDFECACEYLHGGRIDAVSGRISLTLLGCTPGSASQRAQRMRGSFSLNAKGRLIGTLRVDDTTSPNNGQTVDLQFDRLTPSSEVDPADLVCRQPTDAATGNVFSGL